MVVEDETRWPSHRPLTGSPAQPYCPREAIAVAIDRDRGDRVDELYNDLSLQLEVQKLSQCVDNEHLQLLRRQRTYIWI